MPRDSFEPRYRVRLHYTKGTGDLFFKSAEAAAKAVAKVKKDVREVGYGNYVSAADDFGNIEDFIAHHFVRATTSSPDTY